MAIATATATFTGVEDSVAVTWSALNTATPAVSAGVCIGDAPLGPVDVDIPSASITASGCTVVPSARFVGIIEIIASDQ